MSKRSLGGYNGGVTNSGRLPRGVVGIVHHLQWSLEFVRWASTRHQPPTAAQISKRFGVSRATGYRYKAAWDAVASTMDTQGGAK